MPKTVKTRKVLNALNKLGFRCIRRKGSHAFFEHPDGRTTLIPVHKEIKTKLLIKVIKQDLKIEKKKFFKML